MKHLLSLLLFLTLAAGRPPRANCPNRSSPGCKNPESVAIGPDGRIYVSVIGEFDKDGDGTVVVIETARPSPFATGLDDPKGIGRLPAVALRRRQESGAGASTQAARPTSSPRPTRSRRRRCSSTTSPSIPRAAPSMSAIPATSRAAAGAVYRIDPKGTVSRW